jgi:hypothetical protein
MAYALREVASSLRDHAHVVGLIYPEMAKRLRSDALKLRRAAKLTEGK